MVSRRLDLRALLAGLAPGRLALAVLCALLLVATPDRETAVRTWVLLVPLGLALWYGTLTWLARLRAAVGTPSALRGAHLAIGLGGCWVVALLGPGLWVYALAALAAAAYGAAGALAAR